MNVLNVSTHVNIGGIGNYIYTLTKALKGVGANVFVASSGGSLEENFRKCGIRHFTVDLDTKFEFGPKAMFSIPRICSIVRKEKIDIMHAHTRVSQVACFFVSKITGVPYVTTCHGFFKTRLRKIFDTWGRKVIAISESVRVHLECDLGVKDDRIKLIYSGIDIDRFSRQYSEDEKKAVRRSLGLKDYPVIGAIGRLSSVKGHKFLIRAAKDIAEVMPVEVIIVGSGDEGGALKALTSVLLLDDVVHFVDSDIDTQKFLSIMDVFVFPSIKEGLGIALLEALASGKACVASDIGGIKNIITDGLNGLLVRVADHAAISEAVLKILKDAPLSDRFAAEGREMVKRHFSLGRMAGDVLKLYKEVVDTQRIK